LKIVRRLHIHCALTGSSFLSARRTPRFFYFPIGKSAPTEFSSRDPPFFTYRGIGTRDFASVKGRSLGSRIPETRWPVNADLLFPLSGLSYRDFATRDIKQLDLPTPDARCAETPMHTCELTFQLPVTSIGISDFAGSRILMSMFRDFPFPEPRYLCHLSSTNSCGPHCSPVGISRFAIPSCKSILSSKLPILRTPTSLDLLTRVPNDGRF
jgi:hypothetical protein